MKTQHLRQDKTCLNCGHPVPDRFCGHCGQENVETEESLGHLVSHFFQDITHYDSKFLLTLKFLFFYPGLLTREYIAGKRMSYVNPIRLYIFTSFVFFLMMGIAGPHASPYERKSLDHQQHTFDSLARHSRMLEDSLRLGLIPPADTTAARNRADILRIMGAGTPANSARRYDSAQNALPPHLREAWWERKITMRTLQMQEKYGVNSAHALQDKILHHYPKLFFLLLPFFALLLKWFFYRKKWVYVNHAIFSIHIHTFVFMVGIIGILLDMLLHSNEVYSWLMIPVYVYFVFALRNAYQVRMRTAFWKSLGILWAYLVGTFIVLIGFLLFIVAIM